MILVTGATGSVGGEAVRQLTAMGSPVRALVRNAAKARLAEDVEVHQGDLADPSSLEGALKGVAAVFLIWPLTSAEKAPAVLDKIGRYAKKIVYLSSAGVDDESEVQADPVNGFHAELERLVTQSGLRWTIVRGGGFATNDLGWAADVRGGIKDLPTAYPDARRAVVHEADLAGVAVKALTEGTEHDRNKYLVTGPETLTTAERIATIGQVLGRPLEAKQVAADDIRSGLLKEGLPPDFVEAFLVADATFADPDHVELLRPASALLGRPARTYRQWVEDHIADFAE